MTALETALLQDEPAQTPREVLIFCDNEQVLNRLEKHLASFPVMQHAGQVYESTKDYRYALDASLWEHYDLERRERPNGSSSLSPIRERTLAAYYQLLERGTHVQCHWVPAHNQILGNDVADQWAHYACRWHMNAITSTCVSTLADVMVFPLATVHLDCNHLGLPMMGETITEMQARENMEIAKNLCYSLSTSNRLGRAFTSTTTATLAPATVPSTVSQNITARPSQLAEDNLVQIAANPKKTPAQRASQRRKQRRFQKCGRRRRHTAAQCEQRSLRAACGLEGNSHTEDECYTTRSTPFVITIIADRLCQRLARWRDLVVEAITNAMLVLLIYVYGGGLAWLVCLFY